MSDDGFAPGGIVSPPAPPPNTVPMQAVVQRLCERIAQLEFENAILRCQVEAPVSPPGEPI